jgi:hypothetical protein
MLNRQIGYFLLLNFFFAILNGALEETKNALPKVNFWDNCKIWAKEFDDWAHHVQENWMSRRSLAGLDKKIGKLPISVSRSVSLRCMVCVKRRAPYA